MRAISLWKHYLPGYKLIVLIEKKHQVIWGTRGWSFQPFEPKPPFRVCFMGLFDEKGKQPHLPFGNIVRPR
jgi:hypothetical protein